MLRFKLAVTKGNDFNRTDFVFRTFPLVPRTENIEDYEWLISTAYGNAGQFETTERIIDWLKNVGVKCLFFWIILLLS